MNERTTISRRSEGGELEVRGCCILYDRPLTHARIGIPSHDSYVPGADVISPTMSETLAPELIALLKGYDRNMQWAVTNQEALAAHRTKFVAVADGQVIDVEASKAPLREKYHDRPEVYITFVAPKGLRWVL
jgi:hypothetical protein